MFSIRGEDPKDIEAVRTLNRQAFGQPAEADIVDRLRRNCEGVLSLVAVDGDDVVGHILFSPATVEGPGGTVIGMGLAPMAVLSQRQREGIGSALVRHGLDCLASNGCPFVIVLGHAKFYPRFGFVPASTYDLCSQWEGVPDAAFRIKVFDEAACNGVSGVARYRDEFDEAM